MNYNRFNVLGVSVSAVNMEQTINGTIDKWIKNNHKNYIVLTGVHGVIEMQNDEELKNINNNSGLTTPDGMPLVWLGRKKLLWDAENMKITNLDDANQFVTRVYRKGWEL